MSSETFATSAFWKRLDTIGTDVVRLLQSETGWRLTGTAVFLHETTNAQSRLDYDIVLGRDWTTSRGTIRGFAGESVIDQTIIRDDEGWSMNGVRVPGLDGVVDLDLGFTPATNFAQVKRIALPIGRAVDFSVAWWDAGESALVALPQHYALSCRGAVRSTA